MIQNLLSRRASVSKSKMEFTFAIRVDHIENVPAHFQPKVAILVRINNTIVGKTEFRVVTTNTGEIKYNQTFEFETTLMRNKDVFDPKYLSLDVLVKKAKIETVSRNHTLNLSIYASSNRQVTEKETITITVHDGIDVPLTVMIGAVPSSVGRRKGSLEITRTRKSSSVGVQSSASASSSTGTYESASPLTTYLPTTKTTTSSPDSQQQQQQQQQSRNSGNSNGRFDEMLKFEDLMLPDQSTTTTTTTNPSSGFASIARRRTVNSPDTAESPPTLLPDAFTDSTTVTTTATTTALLKENEELKSEVESLRVQLKELLQENAVLKEKLKHENPFADYNNEEEMLENPFHLHTAETIDCNSIDVDSFF